jgi:hypothetical protein
MNYNIETNIPIPPKTQPGKGELKYPELTKLEVGNCISVPFDHKRDFEKLSAAASNYSKRFNMGFTSRLGDTQTPNRIWRIK